MDPMSILLAALAVAGKVVEPAAEQAVKDGYSGLRQLIQRKFSTANPKLDERLTEYAEDPETFEKPAAKALREVGADQDQELIDAATALLKLAEGAAPGVSGGLVGQINAAGGKVAVVGGDVQTINMS